MSTWTIFEISLLHILCVVTIPNRVYRLNTVAAIFVFWQTIPHPPTPNFSCFWRHYLHKCLALVFGTVRGGLELLLHCLKPDTWTEWMVSCSLQHLHIIRSEINDIRCSDISTLYKLPDHLVFHLDNPPVCYVQCSKKPKRLALLLVRTFFLGDVVILLIIRTCHSSHSEEVWINLSTFTSSMAGHFLWLACAVYAQQHEYSHKVITACPCLWVRIWLEIRDMSHQVLLKKLWRR